ncbi:MAG: GDP-mannose 4,6-dehydratase [Bacteroidales bacterium]
MASLLGKNVLVTGGAGFIGSHLCDTLLTDSCNSVIAVDNLFLGKEKNLELAKEHKNFIFINADITDYELIKSIIYDNSIDIIFHLAVVPLEISLENPIWCFDENVKMTENILEIIRLSEHKITLIAYSSSEVYGSALYVPMDENHPMLAHTPYAASKVASDMMVYSYIKTFNIEAAIVRPFNNYGPRQNEGSYAAVIPLTIKRILKGEKPVIYSDGKQTRDFIYVKDTAYWTLEIFNNENTRGEIINLSSGKQTEIANIIQIICNEMNYSGSIERRPLRNGDVRCHQGSMDKAKNIINFNYDNNLIITIKNTIDWYKENINLNL